MPTDEELADKEWIEINARISDRYTVLGGAIRRLTELNFPNPQFLAATDVFVEKAQSKLTRRGLALIAIGICFAVLAMIALALAAYRVSNWNIHNDISLFKQFGGLEFTLLILRATTFSALVLAGVYYLATVAKVLLHEGMILFSKRHALRFGRMYVYLNRGKIDFDELERAFHWNFDTKSAFQDIDTEHLVRSLPGKLIEQPVEMIKAFRGNKNEQAK